MITIKTKTKNINPAVIKLTADCLKRGEVAVLPTDTIYGFSCLADNIKAIKKIRQLKKRDGKEMNKPFLILVGDIKMAKKYAFISTREETLLKDLWFKKLRPTTVILRSRKNLPKELLGNNGGIAMRLPKSEFLIKILKSVKRPLVSTSLNLSGQENINNPRLLAVYWPLGSKQPDLAVDAGLIRRKQASRLIDLRSIDKPMVLRK